ncbi:MAG: cytidine deaminase [Gemmatimonadota bacterium]
MDELIDLAFEVMERAHAPYSNFKVGAALETEDGRRFIGCNVENASYPVTLCAERAALGAAVAAGARRFRRLVLASSGPRPASPCGMCRQALAEFGLDLEVLSLVKDGTRVQWSLRSLLPACFVLRGDSPADAGDPAAAGEDLASDAGDPAAGDPSASGRVPETGNP